MDSAALRVIQDQVHSRAEAITSTRKDWPCRKGCDDCCRHLASLPVISRAEWDAIDAALHALPPETTASVRHRIRTSKLQSRPVVCPLLDTRAGACLVYQARPVACRPYGFYRERENVL